MSKTQRQQQTNPRNHKKVKTRDQIKLGEKIPPKSPSPYPLPEVVPYKP